ncbi:MAG: PLP-dependent aminotransferase family protein [Desulfoprunum sp.]|nr:PLP-dependent aminotransferase family protein [Desulfoprunum sp.]
MRIPLDRAGGHPLYQQIEDFLRQGMLSGNLAAGMRLPAVRRLAMDLQVNRITVENAYARLEADGLIAGRQGSGTYVLATSPRGPVQVGEGLEIWPLWQQGPLARVKKESFNDQKRMEYSHPQPINFGGGIGDPHLLSFKDFGQSIQKIIRRQGATGCTYGDPRGFGPLRATIAQILASQGLQTAPDNILVTTGSQQAIMLVAQLLLRPGDVVVTENPTYSGALDIFRSMDVAPIGVEVDCDGMQVDKLEDLLRQHHPKLLYTIPNFQNPTGVCMSSQRRRQVLELASRYNVPVLEDDHVGDLRYEGCAQPALKAFDQSGMVIYVSTFSKMLMPDLRIGFLVADGPVYDSLLKRKCLSDLATSNLLQRSLDDYLSVGRYQAHLRRSCRIYRKRRDAMLRAIEEYLPKEVSLTPPKGGFYIWLRLPQGIAMDELFRRSCREGVGYAQGEQSAVDGQLPDAYLRLNFAYQPEAEIEEGIRRLARAINRDTPQFSQR